MAKELKIKCETGATVALSKLKNFQGKFKKLNDEERAKLTKELFSIGLCESILVWKDGNSFKIIDGHQRVDVMKELTANGIIASGLRVPVTYCHPKDEKEAREMVLATASTYGRVRKAGYTKFLKDAGISENVAQQSFSFPDLELEQEKEKADKKEAPNTDKWAGAKVVECPKCKTHFYQKSHRVEEPVKADIWDEQNGGE